MQRTNDPQKTDGLVVQGGGGGGGSTTSEAVRLDPKNTLALGALGTASAGALLWSTYLGHVREENANKRRRIQYQQGPGENFKVPPPRVGIV